MKTSLNMSDLKSMIVDAETESTILDDRDPRYQHVLHYFDMDSMGLSRVNTPSITIEEWVFEQAIGISDHLPVCDDSVQDVLGHMQAKFHLSNAYMKAYNSELDQLALRTVRDVYEQKMQGALTEALFAFFKDTMNDLFQHGIIPGIAYWSWCDPNGRQTLHKYEADGVIVRILINSQVIKCLFPEQWEEAYLRLCDAILADTIWQGDHFELVKVPRRPILHDKDDTGNFLIEKFDFFLEEEIDSQVRDLTDTRRNMLNFDRVTDGVFFYYPDDKEEVDFRLDDFESELPHIEDSGAHARQVKQWIKHKVPLTKRTPLMDISY